MAGKGNACRSLCGKPEGKKPFRRPTWWRIILQWVLKKWGRTVWTGFIWPTLEAGGILVNIVRSC